MTKKITYFLTDRRDINSLSFLWVGEKRSCDFRGNQALETNKKADWLLLCIIHVVVPPPSMSIFFIT